MKTGEPTDDEPTRTEVLERVDDPIIAVDTSLTVTYADDSACSLLDAEWPRGTHLDDVVSRAATTPSDAVSQALTRGERTTFAYHAPDGRRVDARVSPGEDGASILLSPADTAEPETLEQLRRIVADLPVAVGRTRLDSDGSFSYVNDAMVEMFEAGTTEAITTRPVGDLYADPDDHRDLHATLRETGRVDERKITFQSLDGDTFRGAVTATLETVGDETYVLKIIQDVTERANREAELRRKTRAIEAAPVGIVITDPDRPDNPMTYVNQGFVDITGYSKSESVGRNCRFLQGENTDPDATDRLREAIDNSEPVTVELRNYRANGTEFWNRVTIAPVEDANGTLTNFVGFQQDITEQKQSETQVEHQRDNLDTLNQVLRHDIRNDLQLVSSYGEMLADHVDDEGREYLDTLLESAENAVELTRTAREIADVMLEGTSDLQPVSLRHTLSQTIDDFTSTQSDAVVRTVTPVPDVTVRANDMLDSVFRNLLSNAVQHNDKVVPEVTISTTVADDSIVVSIADNGPGVPDDQKEDIFGRGEKGLHSEGTGLGLYLVQTLVEMYRGSVWVEDDEPEGALFRVRLPLAD